MSGTGQQMLDLAGESRTAIPVFSLPVLKARSSGRKKSRFLSICCCLQWCFKGKGWPQLTHKPGRANPPWAVWDCAREGTPHPAGWAGGTALPFPSQGRACSKSAHRTNEGLFCWLKPRSICGLLRESGAKVKMSWLCFWCSLWNWERIW